MASNPRRKRAPPYQTTVKGESFSTFLFLFFFSFSLSLRWTKFRSGFFYVLTGCLAHPSFLRLFLFISLAFIRAGLQKYRLRLFQTCYVRDPRCFFFFFFLILIWKFLGGRLFRVRERDVKDEREFHLSP